MRKISLIVLSVISLMTLAQFIPACSDEATVPTGGGTETTDTTYIADHTSADKLSQIPDSVLALIETSLNVYYGHSSHGSQLMSGLALLEAEDSSINRPTIYEPGGDLGSNGDTAWVQPTRAYLDAHPACNLVIWSWCGGCSDNTPEGINIYLNAMAGLEAEYPSVKFVYMTGHLDGTGVDGTLYACNNQIRAYCTANNKLLFDFADIESYDPLGNYYPDETDACGWCAEWCATHTCDDCTCAHSHCFNCYRKGQAFVWLMARLVGWEG